MENLIGKITASLIEHDQSRIGDLIARLNANINPPEPLGEDDVYVRAMYIVSDQVNSYGGCFPVDEHDGLLSLLIDAPVLIGHRKDSLPIARNFHAERVIRDDANWIKVYFYWLKESERGGELSRNIDGGIYKECSISFIFAFPECTICGRDIRECPHQPFVEYDTSTGKRAAFFNYRQIEKVLETSLVYRGSVENTSVTGDLYFTKAISEQRAQRAKLPDIPARYRIWSSESLPDEGEVRLMPAYRSVSLLVRHSEQGVTAYGGDGTVVSSQRLIEYLDTLEWPDGDYVLDCRVIGYRGKERQGAVDLVAYFEDRKSPVRRLEVKVVDIFERDGRNLAARSGRERWAELAELFSSDTRLLIASRSGQCDQIQGHINRITTRDGVEIHERDSSRRYLLTHRKLFSGRMSVDGDNEQKRAVVWCLVDGCTVPVVGGISGGQRAGTVEMECSGLGRGDDGIVATNAISVERCGDFEVIDDIGLLVAGEHEVGQMDYALYAHGPEDMVLEVKAADRAEYYLVYKYSEDLSGRGRRFVADRIRTGEVLPTNCIGTGSLAGLGEHQGGIVFTATGALTGVVRIRPIILNGRHRHIFSLEPVPGGQRGAA